MKNKIQFQKGSIWLIFFRHYGTEVQCRNALIQWRWPQSYMCPRCGGRGHCMIKSRALYPCNQCHHQHSLISGTIFAATK